MTLRDEQGRLQTLERTNPILQHVNYAYSRTSFASQGATKDVVIAVTGVGDRLSGDQAHSYVAMSRVGGKARQRNILRSSQRTRNSSWIATECSLCLRIAP